MDDNRTFVLGLGNQKCGTSWLYKYLCQSNKFAEGFAKEFHVWDRRDISLFSDKKSSRLIENSDDYYFSYFDKLMSGEKVISADISPSYSGLKSHRLEFIKKRFLEKKLIQKWLFLSESPCLASKALYVLIWIEGITQRELN